jgi:sugar lactone lactonase YvrE
MKTCLLVAALLAGTLSGVRPCAAARVGDVDGDGVVSETDAVQVLRSILGLRPPTGREEILGDAWPAQGAGTTQATRWSPGDGAIDVRDVVEVLRSAAELSPASDIGPIVYDVAGSGPVGRGRTMMALREHPEKAGDGDARNLYLFDPWDLAVAPNGDVYFTEYYGERVRVLKPDGTVRTVAGSYDKTGFVNGPPTRALFQHPEGIALLPDGSLAIADTFNNVIRRVAPDGSVTTLAGYGAPYHQDGPGPQAAFYQPNGVCTDPAGNVYVADTNNHRVRKIAPDGTVTTVAGIGFAGYLNGQPLLTQFTFPTGVYFDARDGSLYISDLATVRRLSNGRMVTLAGDSPPGYREGAGVKARFNAPYGLDLDASGRLWVADWLNGLVRTVDLKDPSLPVTTVAGIYPNGSYFNGPARMARLTGLMNARLAPNGWVYLADTDNQRIRVLAP